MFGSLRLKLVVLLRVFSLWHPMVRAVFVSLIFGVGLLLLGYNLAKYQEID